MLHGVYIRAVVFGRLDKCFLCRSGPPALHGHTGVAEDWTCLFLRTIHKLLLILTHTIITGRIPVMRLAMADCPDKSDLEVNHADVICND